MKQQLQKFFALSGLFLTLLAAPAFALDLQAARAQGAVGEELSGYVSALKPGAEVSALVAEVNGRRTQEYARISKTNGQPVDVVAKLAAAQIIGKLPAGSMYQNASGGWQQK